MTGVAAMIPCARSMRNATPTESAIATAANATVGKFRASTNHHEASTMMPQAVTTRPIASGRICLPRLVANDAPNARDVDGTTLSLASDDRSEEHTSELQS